MNDFALFSSFKKKRTKNRGRTLALAASLLTHLIFFGLLIIFNPSFRLNVSPFKSVRTVYLSSPLNLPLFEINNLLHPSSRLSSSPKLVASSAATASESPPDKGSSILTNPESTKPSSGSPQMTPERNQVSSTPEIPSELQTQSLHSASSFALKPFSSTNPSSETATTASPPTYPQAYNFSVIPKDIPDELPWLRRDRYQPPLTSPNPNQKVASKLMASAGISPSSSPINLETITLPPSPPLYDPQLLSSWAKVVVSNIQKKWLELIPHQFHQLRPAQIEVEVDRFGKLLTLQISQSSGDSLLDESLVKAIRISHPFPALPPTFPEDRLLVQLIFQADEK